MSGQRLELTQPVLPKGGGAITGLGETFKPEEFTGTASLSVPIPTSPARGFNPKLSVDYSSGAGGGVFGLGWSLSVPHITRKTSKGIPRYEGSDTFILSGAEELTPCDAALRQVEIGALTYLVHAYRPRVEGLFARIERFVLIESGDSFWRVISKENVTSVFGASPQSRICDPENPRRVFQWLLEETFDDKGNRAAYEYITDHAADAAYAPSERNRVQHSNRYIHRIRYGNGTCLSSEQEDALTCLKLGTAPHRKDSRWHQWFEEEFKSRGLPDLDWRFEVVFDYGDHGVDPNANEPYRPPQDHSCPAPRPDPFSTYHAGFEIRTRWLCRSILMFHRFAELGVEHPVLTHSTTFHYSLSSTVSVLKSVVSAGYRYEGGRYVARTIPPLEFDYTSFEPTAGTFAPFVTGDRKPLPGADSEGYQLVDLYGDGRPGVLYCDPSTVRYWAPEERRVQDQTAGNTAVQFSYARQPDTFPLHHPDPAGKRRLIDLTGNGRLDLVVAGTGTAGYYQAGADEDWEELRSLPAIPTDFTDSNGQLVDLTGNGLADFVLIDECHVRVYPGRGRDGFRPAIVTVNEANLPMPSSTNRDELVRFADMFGTGGNHLVQIRNGEVKCWPHLGYGRFAKPVLFDYPPKLPTAFDARRLFLVDLDGSGTADLVYAHSDRVEIWLNHSGNAFSEAALTIDLPAPCLRADQINFADVLGTGTTALVFAKAHGFSRHWYIDLSQGRKPYLLSGLDNNLGAASSITYSSSTRYALRDKRNGRPWLTRLPFPVPVVEQVETTDHFSQTRLVQSYSYRHGYYDGEEREFRGFGMVERRDAETLCTGAKSFDVPPLVTRTWYHDGSAVSGAMPDGFQAEFYQGGRGAADAPSNPSALNLDVDGRESRRQAAAALRGNVLHKEIYTENRQGLIEPHPLEVKEYLLNVRRVNSASRRELPIFIAFATEVLTRHCESRPDDPRTDHVLVLQTDDFGNVLKEVSVSYGRREPDGDPPEQRDRDTQAQTLITYKEHRFTNAIELPDDHREPQLCESVTYELTGYAPTTGVGRFQRADFTEQTRGQLIQSHDRQLSYEDRPGAGRCRRVIEHSCTLFRPDDMGSTNNNDATTLLPLGEIEPLALPGKTFTLAFTDGLLEKAFRCEDEPPPGIDWPETLGTHGGYVSGGTLHDLGIISASGDPRRDWWHASGQVFLSPGGDDNAEQELNFARSHFFLPHRYRDQFHTQEINTEVIVLYDNHRLLPLESCDALGNRTTVGERDRGKRTTNGNDYHALQPALITDPNGNRSQVAFDALGLVVGTAVMGKRSSKPAEGDTMEGFEPHPTLAQVDAFLRGPEPDSLGGKLLGPATSRTVYDLHRFRRTRAEFPDAASRWQPSCIATIARETHGNGQAQQKNANLQISFTYSDGFGREIQTKAQSSPGKQDILNGRDAVRWTGSGWTTFNNKGQPVCRYEPFATETHLFEANRVEGVGSLTFYDPVGRVAATLHPDRTWEKTVTTPWVQTFWDANDTVLIEDPSLDPDVGVYFAGLPEDNYSPSWYAQRSGGSEEERRAANQTSLHAATPEKHHLDPLGRTFLTVRHNRFKYRSSPSKQEPIEQFIATRVIFGIEDHPREILDADGKTAFFYAYDMLGSQIHEASIDAGDRWTLNDVLGNPICSWDSRGHVQHTEYDALRRHLRSFVAGNEGAPEDDPILTERVVYGEQHPEPEALNLRGKPIIHLDQAGVVGNEAYDFKGNALRITRNIARNAEYPTPLNWSAADIVLSAKAEEGFDWDELAQVLSEAIEDKSYTSVTRYDALNRMTELAAPDGSVVRYGYNRAGLLSQIDANLHGVTEKEKPVWTPFVTDIDYDPKGQRRSVDYGNGVGTVFTYDDRTFRLKRQQTAALKLQKTAKSGTVSCIDPETLSLQDLNYSYDPAGNITHIRDAAQQTLFFRNRKVDPNTSYTYDALYRLIEASGREHLGQGGSTPTTATPGNPADAPRVGLLHRGDGKAMGRYSEEYHYDRHGNIEQVVHRTSDPAHPDWIRTNTFDSPGNRLTATQISGGTPEPVTYDAHGNVTTLSHLSLMQWNHHDQLSLTARQVVSNGGAPEQTWYAYDGSGQRIRSVTMRQTASGQTTRRKAERVYLGSYEICRRLRADGKTVTLQTETLHIMDGDERIALVETHTRGRAPPKTFIRYQLGNHLDSVSLELDEAAKIVSYEEFTPFGGTSYQAVQHQTGPPKRYRYSGKERDEQSGLYYYGARYYAPWLGRWTSPDPAGTADGLNLYAFVENNPTGHVDDGGFLKRKAASRPMGEKRARPPVGFYSQMQSGRRQGMGFSGRATTPSNTPTEPANRARVSAMMQGKAYKAGTVRLHWKGFRDAGRATTGITPHITTRMGTSWTQEHVAARNAFGNWLQGRISPAEFAGHLAENSHILAGSLYGPNDELNAPPASVHQNTEWLAVETGIKHLASKEGVSDKLRIKATGYVHAEGEFQGVLKAARYKIYIAGKLVFDHVTLGDRDAIDKNEASGLFRRVAELSEESEEISRNGRRSRLWKVAAPTERQLSHGHGSSHRSPAFTDRVAPAAVPRKFLRVIRRTPRS